MLYTILDDVMLNWILSRLNIVTLTKFSQTSTKAQILCSDKNFWVENFKKLPFHYDIPDTALKIIAEYRRIYESCELAKTYFDKVMDIIDYEGFGLNQANFDISIKGCHLDFVKIFNSIGLEVDDEYIDCVIFDVVPFIAGTEFKYLTRLLIEYKREGVYQVVSKRSYNCTYIFAQVLYHVTWPSFDWGFDSRPSIGERSTKSAFRNWVFGDSDMS